MRYIYSLCLAALLSACTSQSAEEPATDQATTAASDAAGAGATSADNTDTGATPAADETTADPSAGVKPDAPCEVLPAAEVATALDIKEPLQTVTNQNDVISRCLYQTGSDAQGNPTTLLTLEWTRDVASQQAYSSNKKGLDLMNMKPELVTDLGTEAFWGIESELYAQLPGGMLTVRAAGNTPAEQRARNLKVARLVLARR